MPKEQEARLRPMMDMVKILIPVIVVIVTSLITFLGSVYQNHLVEPKLKCDNSSPTQDRYSESGTYRSMRLVARPQIVVRYNDCLVVSTYLEGYYQNEHIIFTDEGGIAIKADKAGTDALLFYIRNEILESLVQSNSGLSAEAIAANLLVNINILGGVTYTNERGSHDKKFCITEEDGSVLDYGTDEEVIRCRLREYRLKLPDGVSDMDQNDEIKTLIQASAEYIGAYCLDSADAHFRLPRNAVWVIAIIAILFLAYQTYHWHRKIRARTKKLLQKLCGMDWPQWLAITAAALVITVPLARHTANAVTETRDERLTYAELDITTQQSTDILFTPEQPKAPDPPDPPGQEEDPEPTVLERLHILEEFLGADISDSMLKSYGQLFSRAYQDGTGGAPAEAVMPQWFHIESKPYTSLDQGPYDAIAEEAGKCSYSRRPANLYHLGRVLTGTVLTDTELGHPTLDFEALLHIAADGVACGESFLSYADHSIGENEGDIRDAEDIALLNGKVYWALANALETVDAFAAYRDYAPCLWAAGFKCIEQGRSLTTEEDSDYATMTYYLGNFSERMLPYIPQGGEDGLYSTTAKAALDYYEDALAFLNSSETSYNAEDNMADNIQSGITTLNGLGFYSDPDTP